VTVHKACVEALQELVRLRDERDKIDAVDAKDWTLAQSLLLSKSTTDMRAAWEAARAALQSHSSAAHTDHPLRHFDRTCPACNADAARNAIERSDLNDSKAL
jgi:hypothetical protein